MSSKPFLLAGTILLAGCAANPKISYSLVRGANDLNERQVAVYALQESIVTIKAAVTGEGAKQKTTVSADYERQDHPGTRLAIFKADSVGINTNVTIKKFENTDIPSEVTIKVDDLRAELINKLGPIVISALKFAAGFSTTSTDPVLPARLNLTQLITEDRPEEFSKDEGGFRIVYGEIPADAMKIESAPLSQKTSFFYYAACRSATIQFRYNGELYQYAFKVSDPHYLQRERMPVDGKITMHTQCGASVTGKMSSDDATATLTVAAALLTQAQAIQNEIKAESKEGE